MTFLPPVRECINRFARCMCMLNDSFDAASAFKKEQQHLLAQEIVPCLVELRRAIVELCPARCPIRFHNGQTFALEEDDLICLGLGDWDAAFERVLSHDRSAMISVLTSVCGASGCSNSLPQQQQQQEQRVFEAAKVAVLGKARAASGAAAQDGNLAKASRRHQRRVESMMPSTGGVAQSSFSSTSTGRRALAMQAQLRCIESVILVVLLLSSASSSSFSSSSSSSSHAVSASSSSSPSPSPSVSAVEILCSSALLAMVPQRILSCSEREELVRRMPWNAARQRALLSKVPPLKIAVLQRFARRLIALRRCRQARELRLQRVQPLFQQIASRFRSVAHQDVLRGVVGAEVRGAELQDYIDNEEARFKEEWRRYEAGLKNFYMSECELDAQVWKAVSVKDEASGEMNVRYLDLRSGKLQTEHPHKDRVFQVKQRQWLAATRTRSATIARANTDLESLQRSVAAGGSLANEMMSMRREVVASGLSHPNNTRSSMMLTDVRTLLM